MGTPRELDKIDIDTKGNWDKYRKRQWLSEHPLEIVKRRLDAYYVLTKELKTKLATI
ncbi:hypothetical protein [Brassicibacter mesophilus]|uniref:hypothetical protein n=1 Tax=Brassicibacter mesophilus TaxID=745119 RepID=UPI003D219802